MLPLEKLRGEKGSSFVASSFMSCTDSREVAEGFALDEAAGPPAAKHGQVGTLIEFCMTDIDHGASLKWLSQVCY